MTNRRFLFAPDCLCMIRTHDDDPHYEPHESPPLHDRCIAFSNVYCDLIDCLRGMYNLKNEIRELVLDWIK